MAVGGISGMGDIQSMVGKIVEAERAPKQQIIDNSRIGVETRISAYGKLRESLSAIQDLASSFRNDKLFDSRAAVTSNPEVALVTAFPEASAGDYAVEVKQIAQNHKLISEPLDEKTKFSRGSLDISMGDQNFHVELKAHAKLTDIATGINNSKENPGVQASIIKDVEGFRLVLTSTKTGEEKSLKVDIGDGSDSKLYAFEFNSKRIAQNLSTRENAIEQRDRLLAEADRIEAESPLDPTKPENQQDLPLDPTVLAEQGYKDLDNLDKTFDGFSPTADGSIEGIQRGINDSAIEHAENYAKEQQAQQWDYPGYTNTASGAIINEKERDDAATAQANAEKVRELREQADAITIPPEGVVGMLESQKAQDSLIVVDGVAHVSSDTNVLEDVIHGVNITLKSASENPIDVHVSYDKDLAKNSILQFVNAYNQFHQVAKELSLADPKTGKAGPLSGDSTVRTAESRLSSLVATPIHDAPKDMHTLSAIGVTTTRQGTLEVNNTLLSKAVDKGFTKLESFFGGYHGFSKKVEDSLRNISGAAGSITNRESSLREQSRRLDEDQVNLDKRIDALEDRTKTRFTAMKKTTGKMQEQLAKMQSALG